MRSIESATTINGGKALGLRRLMEIGLRVPQGVVLASADVERLLAGNSLDINELEKWLSTRSGLIAVRSSAQNEDGSQLSFAGMYKTKLAVRPILEEAFAAISEVAKSGQSARVQSYSGATSETIPIILQDLVDAEASGVLFSRARDVTGEDCVYVEWVSGLGDDLVSGRVVPATVKIPRTLSGEFDIKSVQTRGPIPQPQYLNLWAELLTTIDMRSPGNWDIEWTVSSERLLFALQMRPQTADVLVPDVRASRSFVAASVGVASGPAVFVDDSSHERIKEGDLLVAKITEADYIPAMKRAAGIITEEGGLLSHAAIVAREFGKPCVVGFANALTLLEEGSITEINGNLGLVHQGERTFGQSVSHHLDWRSLYLYDRGIELSVEETALYIEPTIDGLLAFVDEGCDRSAILKVNAALRKQFHQAPDVVEGDRRIWHREWRRFDQLRTVGVAELLFKTSVASWILKDLLTSISGFKRVVERVSELRDTSSPLQELFWGEIGAALHASVSMQVEGKALWASFRDSAMWRAHHGVSFADLLAGRQNAKSVSDENIINIAECLTELGKLRNDAYYLFHGLELFNNEYFPKRNILVEKTCSQLKLHFTDEDTALSQIYSLQEFRSLDQVCFAQVLPVAAESLCI